MKTLLFLFLFSVCFLGSVSAQNPTLIYSSNGVRQVGGPVGKVTLTVDGTVLRTNSALPYVRNDILNNQTGGVRFVSGNVISGSSDLYVTNFQAITLSQTHSGRPNLSDACGVTFAWPSGDFVYVGQAEGGGLTTTNFNGTTNNIAFFGINSKGQFTDGPDGRTTGIRFESNYQVNNGGTTSTNYEGYIQGNGNRDVMWNRDSLFGPNGAFNIGIPFGQGNQAANQFTNGMVYLGYDSVGAGRVQIYMNGSQMFDWTKYGVGNPNTIASWKSGCFTDWQGPMVSIVGMSMQNVTTNGTYTPSADPTLAKKVWIVSGGSIVTLPQAAEAAYGATRSFWILDRFGTAGVSPASNIVIKAASGQTIEGSTNYTLTRNFESAYLMAVNTTNWTVVAGGASTVPKIYNATVPVSKSITWYGIAVVVGATGQSTVNPTNAIGVPIFANINTIQCTAKDPTATATSAGAYTWVQSTGVNNTNLVLVSARGLVTIAVGASTEFAPAGMTNYVMIMGN